MPPHEDIDYDQQSTAIITHDFQQYKIRPMLETDVDTVAEIDRITWPDESWPADNFLQYLNHPIWKCWILESTTIDNSIFGYGLQYSTDSVSHIANFCIHPSHRGCGLGGILLLHMIDYARQNGDLVVELEVDTSNEHAYRLYVKYGFTIIQFLERFYSDIADGFRMHLIINKIDSKL